MWTKPEAGNQFKPQGAAQPSRGGRYVSAWLVLAAALLVAAGAAYVIIGLRGHVDEDRRALLLLKGLEAQANRLSTLEEQAISGETPGPEAADEAQDVRGRMWSSLNELASAEKESEEEAFRRVEEAFRVYAEAFDDEFRLIAAGRLEEAEAVDEERVDPSFERLSGALRDAALVYEADAQRTSRIADVGSALTLALAAGLVGLIFWRYERTQRAATLAVAEQEILRKSEELFRYQALHDPLTNLPNRTLFMDRLEHALVRVDRKIGKIAVLFVDLDNFKVVNDSLGLILSTPDDHADADGLLRDADAAMYEAKKKGKAGYEVFQPDIGYQAVERLRLETEMNRAIERGEFRVHYQPLIELETGRIGEVEALVRWEHPERGLLPPGEFLPLAEETGLIMPIGRFVLREACRQVREWQERYPSEPPLVLGVNLSARQFRQSDMVGEISRTLEETRLDPRTLKLEITESIAVDDIESAIAILRELKAMGVLLAIDDFGTGYSSLSYIRRFPIDVLKIARPFVDGLGRNSEDTALVRATIAFAKAFKLDVTGEGIETAEQLAQLRALGCDTGQGYYFAKPLPSDAAGRLFSEA